MDFIKNFLDQYGTSLVMMIVFGFVIAFITEIAVKTTFEWLKKKVGDKTWLPAAKAICIQILVIAQVIYCTSILLSGLPFPGGKLFFPVYMCLLYLVQYAWSLVGFKKFLEWLKSRKEKKEQQKAIEEANKPVLTKVPGTEGLYVDAAGTYYDAKGKRI